MMEREELERRYKEAQFAAAAYVSEQQATSEQQQEGQPQENREPEEAPTFAQRFAQAARIKPTGLDDYMSPDDRLRRWAGLK